MPYRKPASYRAIALVAGFALSLFAVSAQAQVVVSSKIDTEGGVLGNIVLQVLKAHDIPTTDRISTDGTQRVQLVRRQNAGLANHYLYILE